MQEFCALYVDDMCACPALVKLAFEVKRGKITVLTWQWLSIPHSLTWNQYGYN